MRTKRDELAGAGVDPRTIDCWAGRIAELAPGRGGKGRPDHALNDHIVSPRTGVSAISIYKRGSNYMGGKLVVIAIVGETALLAGPMGPAMIAVSDLAA